MDYLIAAAKNVFRNHLTIEVADDPGKGKIVSVVISTDHNKNYKALFLTSSRIVSPSQLAQAVDRDPISVSVEEQVSDIIKSSIERAYEYDSLRNSFWKRLVFLFQPNR